MPISVSLKMPHGSRNQPDHSSSHSIEKGMDSGVLHQPFYVVMSDYGEGKGGGKNTECDGNRSQRSAEITDEG